LATLTKISSLFLLPFIGLALAIYVARREFPRWGEAARRIAADYLYWLLAAAATFVALWPALWVRPGPAIRLLWDYVSQAGGEGFAERGVFFWGQIFPDDPGPAFYPVALAFRVGPLVLPGLVILAALAIARLRRGRVRLPGSAFNVGALAAFALSYIVFMSLGALKYDRYLLPVFPALNALAGFGLWRGALALSRLTKAKNRAMMAAAAMLPLLLAQAAVCRNVHPYYYAYYNPWLGGIRQAQNMVWVGHGEGIERVAAYLDAKPETETVRLASAMSSKFEPLFAGQTIPMSNLDGRWVQADYVFIYISQLKRGKHDPEILDYLARREPEYRLNLQGIEFGTLYPGPAAQFYSGSKLEGRGALYGYTLGETQLWAGTTLTATLYWRNEGQRPDDVFWARLVDAAGYPWAEAISQPRPGFEEAARIRKAIVESEAALALPIGMPPGDYVLQMGFAADGGATPVGMFSLPPGGDDVRVTLPDSFPAAVTAPRPLTLATGDLQLLGYDLSPEAAAPGERGWLTLYWRAAQNAPRDYVIAVQLLDAGGQEAAYWLGRPVYSGSPTDTWVQGQVVQDPWELSLPADALPGNYRLELALYDAATADMVARAPLGPWIIAAP
ncbi:MAG: hypothetical protein ACE5G8_05525, partial [Anaerolineae bacterium]